MNIYKSKSEIATHLCRRIEELESAHFQKYPNKPFVVAIAGGSLPSMLEALNPNAPEKWIVLLADERIVPINHQDSNGKLLLDHMSMIHKENIITIDASLEPEACALDYESKIKPYLPLNVALLGMGPDGHICSLFPNHPLLTSKKIVDFIVDSPKPPPKRITLTLPVLNNAENRMMVATGIAKQSAVQGGIAKDMSLPVSHLKDLVWYLDTEAAIKK